MSDALHPASAPPPPAARRGPLTLRALAAVLGGYVFCWGLMALGTAGWHALGMAFKDAEQLAHMLGLLAYVAVFLWAFAARRVSVVWGVLAGGGTAMLGLAWLIQRQALA